MENKQKNQTKTKTFYILGEMFGKVAVRCTGVAFLSFVAGIICMLLWDIAERREENKKQK